MTVQDLYNILEKEIDEGNLTVDSEVYFDYNYDYSEAKIDTYTISQSDLILME